MLLVHRRRCRRRRDSTTEKSIAESEMMMMMMMSVRGCSRERERVGGLGMKIMSRKRFVVNFNMAMAGMLLRGG